MSHTVIGVFDQVIDAQNAVDSLVSNGYSRSNIDLSAPKLSSADSTYSSTSESGSTVGTSYNKEDESFGDSVSHFFKSLFSDDDDESHVYSNVSRNRTIVTVHSDSKEESERAAQILDRFGAADINDRSKAAQYSNNAYSNTDNFTSGNNINNTDTNIPPIQIIEEQLNVGKREVETGGVRLKSRIIERPVEETLRLREERVYVNRNPVNRPATEADLKSFNEGSIEVTSYAEVPVVAKEARVVEEVTVGKAVQEHEQTIKDTVRRTDVEVEEKTRKDDVGLSQTSI